MSRHRRLRQGRDFKLARFHCDCGGRSIHAWHQSQRVGGGAERHGGDSGCNCGRLHPAARGGHPFSRRISAGADAKSRGRRILARANPNGADQLTTARKTKGLTASLGKCLLGPAARAVAGLMLRFNLKRSWLTDWARRRQHLKKRQANIAYGLMSGDTHRLDRMRRRFATTSRRLIRSPQRSNYPPPIKPFESVLALHRCLYVMARSHGWRHGVDHRRYELRNVRFCCRRQVNTCCGISPCRRASRRRQRPRVLAE